VTILADSPTQQRRIIHVETRGLHKAVETHKANLADGLDAIIAIGEAEGELGVSLTLDQQSDAHNLRALSSLLGMLRSPQQPTRNKVAEAARELLAGIRLDQNADVHAYLKAAEALRERAKPPIRSINTRSDTGLRRAGE
jgi:hypothetical protein